MVHTKYWFWLLCFSFFGSAVVSVDVSFTGSAEYILSNEDFTMTCSSNSSVRGQIAKFYKNTILITNIKYTPEKNECYSIPQNGSLPFLCDSSCSCSSDGKAFTWTYNGLLTNKSVTFKCDLDFGDNTRNITSTELSVDIAYAPNSIFLEPNKSIIAVNESDVVGKIYCTADCVPNCTYTWSGPGITGDPSVLDIQNIQRDRDGIYICTAKNTYGDKQVEISIIVQYGPERIGIYPPDEAYSVQENKSLGPINCTSLCNPQCTHVWTGRGIEPMQNRLTISSIQRTNTGPFTCTSSNIVDSREKQIIITVEYGPASVVLIPPLTTITINESDQVGPIHCNASCVPNCTYRWNGPGLAGIISVLNFSNTQRSRNGTFTCTAENTYGIKQIDIRIVVQYGPDRIMLSPSKESYTIVENHTLGPIECSSVCYPQCSHEWTGPGIVPTANIINLSPIKRNNTGHFICSARNIVGSKQKQIKITVQYGPSSVILQPSQSVITVNESDNVGPILCRADCVPNCTHIWTGPGIIHEVSTLHLTNIQRNISGNYTCTASNDYGSKTEDIRIVVQYGPSRVHLKPDNHTYNVKEHNSLDTIACSASCLPQCEFNWAGPFVSTSSEKNLNLTKIHRRQSGNYICTAFNSLGSANIKMTVTVLYAAKVLFANISKDEITENSNATLDCGAEGLPVPEMSWYHLSSKGEKQLLKSTNTTSTQHELSFVKCTDTGTYICEAQNYLFTLSNKSTTLNVTCSPKLQTDCSSEKLIAVKSNVTVFLKACFLSNPVPRVNWTLLESNKSIPVNDEMNRIHQNSSITYTSFLETTLLNTKQEQYSVFAYNSFGISVVEKFTVVVEDRPFPPTDVNATCKGINTLYWTSNFNGGSEQVFRIIYYENNNTGTELSQNISDTEFGQEMYTVFSNLKPNTHYTFTVIALNKFNKTPSKTVHCLTAALSGDGNSNTLGVIGGITGTSLAIILIVIVIVVVLKKRRSSKHKSDSEGKGRKILTSRNKDDEEEDGLKDNILYESAGHDFVTDERQIGAEYASVTKNKNISKVNGGSNIQETALYAEVKKSKNDLNAEVYTNVVKGKTNKEKNKLKLKDFREDVYEIISGENGNVASSFHENNSRNKDGLIYADLTFNPSPNGPRFIHGVEDRTIYADVDTTQKIDPLPDSDEEDAEGKNTNRE